MDAIKNETSYKESDSYLFALNMKDRLYLNYARSCRQRRHSSL